MNRTMPPDRRNFLMELERNLCACCRPAVRRVASRFKGQRFRVTYRDVVLPERLALAVRMLDSGMTRRDARAALEERLQIGKTTASALVGAALDARRTNILPPTEAGAEGLRQLALAIDGDQG